MKKGVPISAAVFNFIFGAELAAVSSFLLIAVFGVFFDLQSLLGADGILIVLLLLFPFAAIFYLAFAVMIIVCGAGLGLGAFAIASGVFLITGVRKADYKKVRKFALAQVVIQSLAITVSGFGLLIRLVRLADTAAPVYGFGAIAFGVILVTAICGVVLNSVCVNRRSLTPRLSGFPQNSAAYNMTERGRELLRILNDADPSRIGYVLGDEHVLQAQRLDAMLDRCKSEQDVAGLIINAFRNTTGAVVSPDKELTAQIFAIKR